MTSRATTWRSNQLSYTHHIFSEIRKTLVRQKGLEPLAYCLEGSCSIQLSYWRVDGAGDGNRTHVASLEGWNSTIELHPHTASTALTIIAKNEIFVNSKFSVADFLKNIGASMPEQAQRRRTRCSQNA